MSTGDTILSLDVTRVRHNTLTGCDKQQPADRHSPYQLQLQTYLSLQLILSPDLNRAEDCQKRVQVGRRKNKGGENFRENGSDTEGKSVTQGGKRQNRERKVTAPARGEERENEAKK